MSERLPVSAEEPEDEERLRKKMEIGKRLVMGVLEITEERDWRELWNESEEAALVEITEEDGTPVDPESLSQEEIDEAVMNYLLVQYVMTLGEEAVAELFRKEAERLQEPLSIKLLL